MQTRDIQFVIDVRCAFLRAIAEAISDQGNRLYVHDCESYLESALHASFPQKQEPNNDGKFFLFRSSFNFQTRAFTRNTSFFVKLQNLFS